MAAYDSTMSVASRRAARSFSALSPSLSALSHRSRVATASKNTSTLRSSRPLRRTLATELRCAMAATRRVCSSTYSRGLFRATLSPWCTSRRPTPRSWLIAFTMSLRAFSSISMSSEMYFCSKLAQAKSSATRVLRISERVGRVCHWGCSWAWPQRSRTMPSCHQARCKASALLMASALNSNLSPFTQITAYCSKLASSTSTR
mmetsp:Transcript_65202/g.170769  ORF Transcript_65202/g.170769 Transcript_65202/m.170769 type:complete len:203 (+) Transcript_65202:401-1009(+)